MKFFYTLVVIFFNFKAWAYTEQLIDLKSNSNLGFIEHIDEDDASYGNSLALNVNYESILKLRTRISTVIGKKLKFFQGWSLDGEAHVTTITPPEYVNTLRHYISIRRIHEIAIEENIQSAELEILGIGSGEKIIDGTKEQTFFVIVDSAKLRHIRMRIYREFVKNGGNPRDFDPHWFFPHITIGFTLRDIHEPDILKNIKYSLDIELQSRI